MRDVVDVSTSIHIERPRRVVAASAADPLSTSEGPFPVETTYTWEDVGAGATRMTYEGRAVRR
jgi:hypothetical protein